MKNPAISFNPNTHTYLVNGERYISVTQLLKEVGIIETRWFPPGSAERGQEIHKITESIDRGSVIPHSVENGPHNAYISAYRQFLMETSVKIRDIEKIVVHCPFKYAGTIDRLAIIDNENTIIDIKSGQVQDWHGIQLAAYNLALGSEDQKLYGLYLRKTGKYYLKEYNAKHYAEIFLTALKVFRWKGRGYE
jgi:RecB family exonuclease